MLDLHTHSTFSDGSDAPATLVRQARRTGLRAVALTDHDNAAGVPEFLDACRREHVTGLAGVEISLGVEQGTLHLLGLGIDPRHAELNEKLALVLDGRDWRNRRILERLNALGCALTWEEVAAYAGEDVVGRPHFAAALLARGLVASRQEAFDRLLAKGAAAYVDRFRLEPAEGIRLIVAAGGVPILAHPYTWEPALERLADRLAELRDVGLRGLEAYYPEHDPGMTVDYLRLAARLGLLVSGGSDYHGANRPGVALGRGDGSLDVPDALLEPLLGALGPGGVVHVEDAP